MYPFVKVNFVLDKRYLSDYNGCRWPSTDHRHMGRAITKPSTGYLDATQEGGTAYGFTQECSILCREGGAATALHWRMSGRSLSAAFSKTTVETGAQGYRNRVS